MVLALAACAPTSPAANNAGMMQTPAALASAGNGNLPMQTQTGNGGMTPAKGVMNATATPGAMTSSNPAAAQMMEPITAPMRRNRMRSRA